MTTAGPVEYVVIAFSGEEFRARIAPALSELSARGALRVLDVVFISKDGLGDVEMRGYDPCDDRSTCLTGLGIIGGVLSDLDALYAAEELGPGGTAALLAWERPGLPGAMSWMPTGRPGVGGPIPHEVATVALDDLVSV